MAAIEPYSFDFTGESAPEVFYASLVTEGFFEALGVGAAYGRTFLPEEFQPGSGVVILTHGFWERRFGGDTAILGRSISRARTRLGSAPFEALRAARVGLVADLATRGAWYRGRRLVAFDGSTLNVPDEATNRQTFGVPGASRGRAAFPQVRIAALVEVGTRAAFAWRAGGYDESEDAQVEALLPRLSEGMLVLADRGYCSFPLWQRAADTGADLLWRMKTNLRLPVLERFDDGSYRSVLRGSGLDRRRSRGERPVRVVEYRLDGTSDAVYRLATTLLDPAAAPAAELAALYHERWEVETAYDEVKTHILGPGAMLRSKTPELVRQEVHGLMLAHYAVRRLIHEAARKVDEDPDRLSFIHAVRVVRRRVENPGISPLGSP